MELFMDVCCFYDFPPLNFVFSFGFRGDYGNAVEVLRQDLKVFSSFNEDLFKEITLLLTLPNFRYAECFFSFLFFVALLNWCLLGFWCDWGWPGFMVNWHDTIIVMLLNVCVGLYYCVILVSEMFVGHDTETYVHARARTSKLESVFFRSHFYFPFLTDKCFARTRKMPGRIFSLSCL